MKRLKTVYNILLHVTHTGQRVIYSNFEVNTSPISNTSFAKIRSSYKLGEFINDIKHNDTRNNKNIMSSQLVSNESRKCTYNFPNKKIPLVLPSMERKHTGLFHHQNYNNLSSSQSRMFNYINVRQYSDEPLKNLCIPPLVQLDGIWKTLAESAPVEASQNTLVWLHSATGLPWWATIVLATFSIRTAVTVPLALYQTYVMAKFYNLKYELDEIVKNLKLETNYAVYTYKWSEKYARAIYNRSFRKQRQLLIERDNCHPLKSLFLVAVQVPMWITLSASLRNLCYMLPYYNENAQAVYLELTTGGFGFMMNLTVPDGTYIIPVTLGLLNLSIIEMQCLMRVTQPTKPQRYLTNVFRIISVAMVPLASYVPSAMSLYWVSSSAFGLAQNFLLMSPRLRRFVGIPEMDTDIEQPYRHLYLNLRRRIGLQDVYLETDDEKQVKTNKKPIKY